jgi:hypothetical protein
MAQGKIKIGQRERKLKMGVREEWVIEMRMKSCNAQLFLQTGADVREQEWNEGICAFSSRLVVVASSNNLGTSLYPDLGERADFWVNVLIGEIIQEQISPEGKSH